MIKLNITELLEKKGENTLLALETNGYKLR